MTLLFSCTPKSSPEANSFGLEINKSSSDVSVQDTTNNLKYTSGIRSILHDSKGNYWFGSHQEGVCIFNGESFTYFTIDDGLCDNQIRTIQEDQDGVIWFGTGNGVSSYNEGIINKYTTRNALTGLKTTIEGDWTLSDDDLWFNAGNKSGVCKFDGQVLSYLEFPIPGDGNTFNVYEVTGFSNGEKGNIWIATYAAVFGYDGTTFEIIDDKQLGYIEESEMLHVRSILEDSKGNLWIGNNGIGVLVKSADSITNFSRKHGLVQSNILRMGDTSIAGTLEHVFAITEDSDGHIWFGDRDTGAWIYDGKSMTNYTIDEKLKNKHVWEIYQDRNGELLFAMAGGGVYKFNGELFERKY